MRTDSSRATRTTDILRVTISTHATEPWGRFLGLTGIVSRNLRLEPDGQAIGCNPIKVGSTPTGLFRP